MSVLGFETRSVADTALLLDVGAGTAESGATPARGRRSHAGPLRVALSTKPPAPGPGGSAAPARAWRRPASCCARSATHVDDARPRLRRRGRQRLHRPLPRRASRRTWRACRARTASSGARAASARLGGRSRESLVERARRDAAAHAERINRVFDDFDVLVTPDHREAAGGRGRVGGHERRPHAARDGATPIPTRGIWNHTGQPACSVPAPASATRPAAGRAAGRPPGQRGARCSRWPRSSRPRPWAGPPRRPRLALACLPRARGPPTRHAHRRAAAARAARPAAGGHLRVRADRLRPRARGQRAAVRGLRAAQALPRARGLRRHAGGERHRRERQDLRRRARAGRRQRAAGARDDRRLRGGHRRLGLGPARQRAARPARRSARSWR